MSALATETISALPAQTRTSQIAAYFELTKPGITSFIMLSAATGYLLAPAPPRGLLVFCAAILGIGFTAAGAAALNEYAERFLDGQMARTAQRPLPSERISERGALAFGIAITLLGVVPLLLFVSFNAALYAAISFVTYVFVYTPMKRRTPLCTLVGGIPGALPIVAGWSARATSGTFAPWTLFAIMFCWQMPHFLALAWLYRAEYREAGFEMITARDPDGRITSRTSIVFAILLLLATTLPFGVGLAHGIYGVAAPVLALLFFLVATGMHPGAMEKGARRLFLASLGFLPAIFTLLLIDHFLRR